MKKILLLPFILLFLSACNDDDKDFKYPDQVNGFNPIEGTWEESFNAATSGKDKMVRTFNKDYTFILESFLDGNVKARVESKYVVTEDAIYFIGESKYKYYYKIEGNYLYLHTSPITSSNPAPSKSIRIE